MERKNRIYIILTGVVALTLIWLSQGSRNEIPELESLLENKARQNAENEERVSTLEGVLWSSDDETRGNLMLVTKEATVYISTTRDFSELVGKYVTLSIDGMLENFTLLNIEENLARDGFIQVN